jgi:hypothetical protein
MSTYDWPHEFIAFQFSDQLLNVTDAVARVYTGVPRDRTYPLVVVQTAGLGPLGTNATIQADQPRLQVDAWAETKSQAERVAGQIFRLWDKRFGGLQDTVLTIEDEAHDGNFYRTNVEKVERTGGGEAYFDEFAQVWRVTSFYTVKVNLWQS